MKDSNDNATLDWVDEAETVMEFHNKQNPRPELPPNPALDKALANIVNITLQDLLAEYN